MSPDETAEIIQLLKQIAASLECLESCVIDERYGMRVSPTS